MPANLIRDLAEGTEFRLVLQARPPRLVHATAWLSMAFLAAAFAWTALTKADLVVRAPGRVRPVSSPLPVRMGARGEILSASLGGRVVQVNCALGQQVRQGELLIRLDTEHLDTDMAKKSQLLGSLIKEIEELTRQEEELAQEFNEATKRAESESAQAQETLRQKQILQASEIRSLDRELEKARADMNQSQRLLASRVVTGAEAAGDRLKYQEIQEKLIKARLPLDKEPVEIARRGLNVLMKQYAGKRRDLTLKRSAREKERADAQKDREALELERAQAEIRAPIAGVVTRGDVKVGTVLEPQQVVVEIAEQNGFLFEVEVPNAEVGQLQVGVPARIKLDSYDFQRYGILEGKVAFISPDSDLGEKPGRASYRVRIQLESDEVRRGEFRGPVKLGMTGQAEIVIDQERLLVLLMKRIRQSISLK